MAQMIPIITAMASVYMTAENASAQRDAARAAWEANRAKPATPTDTPSIAAPTVEPEIADKLAKEAETGLTASGLEGVSPDFYANYIKNSATTSLPPDVIDQIMARINNGGM